MASASKEPICAGFSLHTPVSQARADCEHGLLSQSHSTYSTSDLEGHPAFNHTCSCWVPQVRPVRRQMVSLRLAERAMLQRRGENQPSPARGHRVRSKDKDERSMAAKHRAWGCVEGKSRRKQAGRAVEGTCPLQPCSSSRLDRHLGDKRWGCCGASKEQWQ